MWELSLARPQGMSLSSAITVPSTLAATALMFDPTIVDTPSDPWSAEDVARAFAQPGFAADPAALPPYRPSIDPQREHALPEDTVLIEDAVLRHQRFMLSTAIALLGLVAGIATALVL